MGLGLFLVLYSGLLFAWSAVALVWPEQMIDRSDMPLLLRWFAAAVIAIVGLALLRLGIRLLRKGGGIR